jgi:potassium efflux system protein
MTDHPQRRATLLSDASQPTHDELVVQIQESDQTDSSPNEALRRNIELFSKYGPVFRELAHTVIGALLVPAFLMFIASQLSPYFELTTLRGSVARGLWTLCPPLFACLILARALRPGALAERFFSWSPNLCDGLLKSINVMIWIWLPIRFFYTSLETFDGSTGNENPFPGQWSNSLGRLLFIVAMVAVSMGLWSSARSLRKWMSESDRSNSRHAAFRSLLFSFLPLLPGSLAIMSALGYHFTAIEMSWRMMWTVILMTGIALTGGLISRLMLVAQFGIKLRHLARNDDGEINSDESIDIGGITAQVNRLLRATALVAMILVGWQFWADVFPAINYLDDWILPWSMLGADGVRSPITLRHVMAAFGVLAITFILSRNLPGLLEITLLDRLPLDRGGRYAISFVVRYLVGIIGVIAAFQIAGFTWSSVQFLAGGLMIGLGFGLQEIFSNVISGIIILIERPIRLGDVVTVNNVTGTVTRMQLRATTIKDYDFRELIVPNKKFITEDVMNWTLTDRRSRIILKIGVAYGSDTKLVHDTLLKIANRHALVQSEPEPDVFFKEFGDSTLNFDLRVFIPSREVFAKVQHELNMAIEAEFKAKEIEIAFPQREIHIKNLADLQMPSPGAGPAPPDSDRSRSEKTLFPATTTGTGIAGASVPVLTGFSDASAELSDQPENATQVDTDHHPNADQPEHDARRIVPFPLKQLRGQNDVLPPQSRKAS